MVGRKNVEFILIFLSRHFFVGVLPVALFLLSGVKLPRLVDFAHAAQTQPAPDRSLGGMDTTVSYGGAHASLIGVDQINLMVPGEFARHGDVRIEIEVGGMLANVVSVRVK